MKRFRGQAACLAAAGAALLLTCTACAPRLTPGSAGASESIGVLGLTAEQKREDYDYFWSTLRDSYPCWGLLAREGVDAEAIEREYRALVAESDDDRDFYSAIYSSLWRLRQNGRIGSEPATASAPGTLSSSSCPTAAS